jgi:hypothetical protein
MKSPCCQAGLYFTYGEWLCSSCWQVVEGEHVTKQRDIITWLFPLEEKPRIEGERVFLRYGKKLSVAAQARGRPNGWFWVDV